LTPGFATTRVLRFGVPAVTRSTTAYAGYGAAAACGMTIADAGANGQLKKPAVAVTVAEPVPVTMTAVGVYVASAAHRSQNTVAVPYDVLPANDMLASA